MHSKGESVGREKSGRKEKTSDFKGKQRAFLRERLQRDNIHRYL